MDLKLNKGVIFKNTKKSSDKHPDYRGEINVKGEHFEISLWVNTDKKGGKYFSVGISELYKAEPPESNVYQRQGIYDKPKEQIQSEPPEESDLPF